MSKYSYIALVACITSLATSMLFFHTYRLNDIYARIDELEDRIESLEMDDYFIRHTGCSSTCTK